MVLKRSRRRTNLRSRKVFRRRMTMKKSLVRSNICSFKRSFYAGTLNINNVWNSSTAPQTFNLASLPNYSDIVGMFEYYRINAIKITFIPVWSEVEANQQLANASATVPSIVAPRMYTCIDTDGDYQVSTEAAFLENSNVKIIRDPTKTFSVYYRPKVQTGAATSLAIAGAIAKGKQWIDCANPNINQYGAIVAGITPFATSGYTFNYQKVVTFYMQCKGVQ